MELGYSLSGSTHTPADILRNLAHRLSNRQILTENPSAPPDLLASLLYGDVQAGLAFSPITPTEFLRTLAVDWRTGNRKTEWPTLLKRQRLWLGFIPLRALRHCYGPAYFTRALTFVSAPKGAFFTKRPASTAWNPTIHSDCRWPAAVSAIAPPPPIKANIARWAPTPGFACLAIAPWLSSRACRNP